MNPQACLFIIFPVTPGKAEDFDFEEVQLINFSFLQPRSLCYI